MLGSEKIKDIELQLGELLSIVNFGTERLDEYQNQLELLASSLAELNNQERVTAAHNECRAIKGTVLATKDSLAEWKTKASEFSTDLKSLLPTADDQQVVNDLLCKTKGLIKDINKQAQTVQQYYSIVLDLLDAIAAKRRDLNAKIARGSAPQLETESGNVLEAD